MFTISTLYHEGWASFCVYLPLCNAFAFSLEYSDTAENELSEVELFTDVGDLDEQVMPT